MWYILLCTGIGITSLLVLAALVLVLGVCAYIRASDTPAKLPISKTPLR